MTRRTTGPSCRQQTPRQGRNGREDDVTVPESLRNDVQLNETDTQQGSPLPQHGYMSENVIVSSQGLQKETNRNRKAEKGGQHERSFALKIKSEKQEKIVLLLVKFYLTEALEFS